MFYKFYPTLRGFINARMSIALVVATNRCIRGSRISASRMSNRFGCEVGAGLRLLNIDICYLVQNFECLAVVEDLSKVPGTCRFYHRLSQMNCYEEKRVNCYEDKKVRLLRILLTSETVNDRKFTSSHWKWADNVFTCKYLFVNTTRITTFYWCVHWVWSATHSLTHHKNRNNKNKGIANVEVRVETFRLHFDISAGNSNSQKRIILFAIILCTCVCTFYKITREFQRGVI